MRFRLFGRFAVPDIGRDFTGTFIRSVRNANEQIRFCIGRVSGDFLGVAERELLFFYGPVHHRKSSIVFYGARPTASAPALRAIIKQNTPAL